MIDTSNLKPGEVVNKFEPRWYVEAAAAATEIGADDDRKANPYVPEGFAIAVLAVAACFFGALILAAVI